MLALSVGSSTRFIISSPCIGIIPLKYNINGTSPRLLTTSAFCNKFYTGRAVRSQDKIDIQLGVLTHGDREAPDFSRMSMTVEIRCKQSNYAVGTLFIFDTDCSCCRFLMLYFQLSRWCWCDP